MASVNKAKALLTGHALPFLGRVCTLELPYHGLKMINNNNNNSNETDGLIQHGWVEPKWKPLVANKIKWN